MTEEQEQADENITNLCAKQRADQRASEVLREVFEDD